MCDLSSPLSVRLVALAGPSNRCLDPVARGHGRVGGKAQDRDPSDPHLTAEFGLECATMRLECLCDLIRKRRKIHRRELQVRRAFDAGNSRERETLIHVSDTTELFGEDFLQERIHARHARVRTLCSSSSFEIHGDLSRCRGQSGRSS